MANDMRFNKQECWWGVFFVGSREALIAAGAAEPDWFPGEPGRRKTSVTLKRPEGKISIHKSGSLFHVRRYFPTEEQNRRLAEQRRRDAIEREEQESRWRAKNCLDLAPQSAEDYRKLLQRVADFKALSGYATRVFAGYYLAEEDRDDLARVIAELASIIENAEIHYCPKLRREFEHHMRGLLLPKDDYAFEHFMAASMGDKSQTNLAP